MATFKDKLEPFFESFIAENKRLPTHKECYEFINPRAVSGQLKKVVTDLRKVFSSEVKGISVTSDELEILDQYRRIKREAENAGMSPKDVKHGWIKSSKSSLFFTNPLYKDQRHQEFDELWEELLNKYENYSPEYPPIWREQCTDPHLLVIDPVLSS